MGGFDLNAAANQHVLFPPNIDDFLLNLRRESIEGRTQARGLILDEILEVQKIDGNTTLRCKHLGDQISVTQKFAENLKKSSPPEWAGIGKKKAHVLGLFMVCVDAGGNMKVVNATLFLASDNYILVESYPEVEMANRLVIGKGSMNPR